MQVWILTNSVAKTTNVAVTSITIGEIVSIAVRELGIQNSVAQNSLDQTVYDCDSTSGTALVHPVIAS